MRQQAIASSSKGILPFVIAPQAKLQTAIFSPRSEWRTAELAVVSFMKILLALLLLVNKLPV